MKRDVAIRVAVPDAIDDRLYSSVQRCDAAIPKREAAMISVPRAVGSVRKAREAGIFTFRLYSALEACGIQEQLMRLPEEPPNSMNKYGRVLRGEYFREFASRMRSIAQAVATACYPEIHALRRYPHAFVVDYAPDKQRSLAAHFDSSDVTLNLCLGGEFEGGELVFYDKVGRKPIVELEQVMGQIIVHRGSQVHRAKPTRGYRSNLIVWCQAKKR